MTYQKVILMHRTALNYLVIKQHDDYIRIEKKEIIEPLHHKVIMWELSPLIDIDGLTDFYTKNDYILTYKNGMSDIGTR